MSPGRGHVLVADDEPNMRRVLAAMLERQGLDVGTAADGGEAANMVDGRDWDLVITDLRMGVMDGMDLLRHVQRVAPRTPVVMITAHGGVDTAVEAMKCGAFDFVTKPFDQSEIQAIVAKALRTHALDSGSGAVGAAGDADGAPGAGRGEHGMIGRSEALRRVFDVIDKVAATPSTVLITGESGTGKELVARALHRRSARRDRPFIKINCAAIPDTLVESELFGHEKGAFTGAITAKPGRFELADGGTLFLDEVGEIPLEMQVKLLRVLQDGELERVGGVKTLTVDARLITATNANLPRAIEQGRFREDLYYRLNVVPIALPPLRERREDIPLLVDGFVRHLAARLGKAAPSFAPEAMALLTAFRWPGNIRQLENVIERTLLFCGAGEIGPDDLPDEVRGAQAAGRAQAAEAAGEDQDVADAARTAVDAGGGLKDVVRQTTLVVERRAILDALDRTAGNVTKSARMLRISRKSLQTKMKDMGLRDAPPGRRPTT